MLAVDEASSWVFNSSKTRFRKCQMGVNKDALGALIFVQHFTRQHPIVFSNSPLVVFYISIIVPHKSASRAWTQSKDNGYSWAPVAFIVHPHNPGLLIPPGELWYFNTGNVLSHSASWTWQIMEGNFVMVSRTNLLNREEWRVQYKKVSYFR